MSRMQASAVRELLKVAERPDMLSFAGGLPAPELFPIEAIAEAHARVFAQRGAAALQYSSTEGFLPLREWVVARLARRGIKATVEQVLITSGSQQGIDLTARVLLDPGDTVVIENPSYLAALQTLGGCEATFVPVDSDDEGMRIDEISAVVRKRPVRLVYAVPDFHNPKGTTLSQPRREELIRLATEHRIPVIEDDPYSELRFRGNAPSPLAALDEEGLVVHLGTFSKTLAPGMRLGWLVASPALTRSITIAKQAADLHTATLAQHAVAELLKTFDYDAHLTQLRASYGERCLAMLAALERNLPVGSRWTNPDGGLFVWAQLPHGMRAEDVLTDALREKVAFVPGAAFFAEKPRHDYMRLNYSNRSPAFIDEGMARLGRAVRQRLA
jgi:2-aminoadipate transaminase